MNSNWSRKWPRSILIRYVTTAVLCLLCTGLLFHLQSGPKTAPLRPELRELVENRSEITESARHDIGIVMAKTRPEDVNWLLDLHHDLRIRPFIYSMEPTTEPGCLTPRSRRGREVAPYLSYGRSLPGVHGCHILMLAQSSTTTTRSPNSLFSCIPKMNNGTMTSSTKSLQTLSEPFASSTSMALALSTCAALCILGALYP